MNEETVVVICLIGFVVGLILAAASLSVSLVFEERIHQRKMEEMKASTISIVGNVVMDERFEELAHQSGFPIKDATVRIEEGATLTVPAEQIGH